MKRILFYFTICLFLGSCNDKLEQKIIVDTQNVNKATITILPAFHESLHIDIDYAKKEIKLNKGNMTFVADSLDNETFEMIDSVRFEKIKNLVPKGVSETKKLTDKQFQSLNVIIQKLGSCNETEEDEIGLDGTTIYVTKMSNGGKEKTCRYWPGTGNKDFIALFSLLEEIYIDNSILLDAIENNFRYISNRTIKVVSTEPLYIKLLSFRCECNEFMGIIDTLPKADEIYLDMTNYHGDDIECIPQIIRRKYKHIRWIINDPFDKRLTKIYGYKSNYLKNSGK